jgi:microcystin-dependent protein
MYDDDHFVGEIRMFTGNFAPKGWAFCDGAPVNARQNPLYFHCFMTGTGHQ